MILMQAGMSNENLKNLAQRFSSFNPCPQATHVHLFHPLVTDNRKQFQCQNIVLNNKTVPLFLEFK